MNKKVLKDYAISSMITFFTGFLAVVLMQIDSFSLDTLTSGALLGLIASACRAGVKALIEHIIAHSSTLMPIVPKDSITSTLEK